MSLKDDILAAFQGLTEKTRNDREIAETLSAGRSKPASVLGGLVKFVEILGAEDALTYLSAAKDPAAIDYWLVRALDDARCDLGSPGVFAMFSASKVLTDAQRAKLFAALTVADPITEQEVAKALEGLFDKPVNADEKPATIEEAVEANVKT